MKHLISLKDLEDPRGSFFKSFSEYVGINHQDPKFETEYFLNLLNSIHSGGYRMSEVVQGNTSLVNAIMLWGMGGEYSQSMLYQHLPEDVRDMLNQCDDRLVLKYETKAKIPLTLEEAYALLRASDETSQKSIEYPLDDAIEWAGDSSEQLKRVLTEAHNRDREKSTKSI